MLTSYYSHLEVRSIPLVVMSIIKVINITLFHFVVGKAEQQGHQEEEDSVELWVITKQGSFIFPDIFHQVKSTHGLKAFDLFLIYL